MADITFTGFIERELTNARGESFGFTAAETHRKKQDDGSYKTVARTFHTVKGNAAAGFKVGDRVTVTGRQVTEPWNRDGETRYSLTVWADKVEAAQPGNQTVPPATEHTDYRNDTPPPEDPGEGYGWNVAQIPADV